MSQISAKKKQAKLKKKHEKILRMKVDLMRFAKIYKSCVKRKRKVIDKNLMNKCANR